MLEPKDQNRAMHHNQRYFNGTKQIKMTNA
jgi:hypothetical protein